MKRAGKNRFLTGGVLLLSFCSLISVGFSSWSIGINQAETGLTISADEVITPKISFQSLETFTYFKEGTIYEGVLSNEGDIIAPFRFSSVNDFLKDDTSTSFTITASFVSTGTFNILPYVSNVLFASETSGDLSSGRYVTVENFKNSVPFSFNDDQTEISTELTISKRSLYCGLLYHFAFTNFKKEIYPNMSNTSFKLEMVLTK